MGIRSSQSILNTEKSFDASEKEKISRLYNKYIDNKKVFDLNAFQSDIFITLPVDILSFLKSFYKNKNIKKQLTTLDLDDLHTLTFLILKASSNEDISDIYFRKNTFVILYDILCGKVGAFNENLSVNNVSYVFDLIIRIYINKHTKDDYKYDKKSMTTYLINNIANQSDHFLLDSLLNFIDNNLYNLDSFLKNYFRQKLYGNEGEISLITSFPILTEFSSILSIDQFLFVNLANPHISSKKYAFKLYDCVKNGYNIPNLIYSFLGFSGPVIIFAQHYDKETGSDYILGAYLNSNFKECYENFCGDDLSFLFTIYPHLKFYKYTGSNNPDKICYINSRNQKFSKKEPGIGVGYSMGKCRFWIDSNECFKKSYFNKYDDVFEEGTPFDKPEQFLNVIIYILKM